ncbi:hypothetical protein GCM10007973_32750 [Polymorphobacter multimanifer]|uniref:Uncharacterized protein n=1 Tax=Polymorphobacter multimanifer TaxID=1070431 RepID=A0A841LB24_9SPHN|nr:hypothetical protein [Polymorphobacter multimanifer]MBB6229336.1 hypothetical protein [Polymorphobacter multimanifer]GGI94009.1 hypothetical protein GCM10007973_32750 [Polymorphobacter multimanifer]
MIIDVEAVRTQIRAMDFVRGTPAEVEMWRDGVEDSRANLMIEDMTPTPNENAFFDMMLEEGVSPPLVSQILLRLLDHPDADQALPVTPMVAAD